MLVAERIPVRYIFNKVKVDAFRVLLISSLFHLIKLIFCGISASHSVTITHHIGYIHFSYISFPDKPILRPVVGSPKSLGCHC